MAGAALVNRQSLADKFAVSLRPASGVTWQAEVARRCAALLTAVGRLSYQCALLAEPWLLRTTFEQALGGSPDGSARTAEEGGAGGSGHRARETLRCGVGGHQDPPPTALASRRVAAFSQEDFAVLWKPLERAIPIASLETPAKSKS